MKTYKFKTNINCGGCIATITPYLDKVQGIKEWKVDTDNKNKILTVEAETAVEDDIVTAVKEAGYNIEPAKKGLFGKLL